jgi:hypothetical protein
LLTYNRVIRRRSLLPLFLASLLLRLIPQKSLLLMLQSIFHRGLCSTRFGFPVPYIFTRVHLSCPRARRISAGSRVSRHQLNKKYKKTVLWGATFVVSHFLSFNFHQLQRSRLEQERAPPGRGIALNCESSPKFFFFFYPVFCSAAASISLHSDAILWM